MDNLAPQSSHRGLVKSVKPQKQLEGAKFSSRFGHLGFVDVEHELGV